MPQPQTDGHADRQMTCDRKTALCIIVHHAVKIQRKYILLLIFSVN